MPKKIYLIQLIKISFQIRKSRMIEIIKRFISGQSIITFFNANQICISINLWNGRTKSVNIIIYGRTKYWLIYGRNKYVNLLFYERIRTVNRIIYGRIRLYVYLSTHDEKGLQIY